MNIRLQNEQPESQKTNEYPNFYAPIPANGKTCPHSGLKHAQMYRLLTGEGQLRQHVRVAHITLPGRARGKTLFHVGDLLRFLDTLAHNQGSGQTSSPQTGSALK